MSLYQNFTDRSSIYRYVCRTNIVSWFSNDVSETKIPLLSSKDWCQQLQSIVNYHYDASLIVVERLFVCMHACMLIMNCDDDWSGNSICISHCMAFPVRSSMSNFIIGKWHTHTYANYSKNPRMMWPLLHRVINRL